MFDKEGSPILSGTISHQPLQKTTPSQSTPPAKPRTTIRPRKTILQRTTGKVGTIGTMGTGRTLGTGKTTQPLQKTSTYHCQAFLLYNDTFVDIDRSDIECNITGSASFISTGITVFSKTEFAFKIGFNVKSGISKLQAFESKINRAVIGNLNCALPSRSNSNCYSIQTG